MNKKGISPLIATLILMGFAIALGTVVMSWGQTYIEEKAEFVAGTELSGCGSVQLSLITVKDEVQVCYDTKTSVIQLLVENGPDIDIANFNAIIVGKEVQTLEGILKEPLKKTHALKKTLEYNKDLGTPVKLKLVPILDLHGTTLYCDESSLALEKELHPCS